MPRNYFKLDLYFFEHPKAVDLSHAATVLFLASIAYANRRETDGFIARPVARKLIDLDPDDHYCPALKDLIVELERAVLWEPVEGGWQIHDFFDHNDSSEERAAKREAEREGNRERQRRYRERQRDADMSNGVSRPSPTVTNDVSHPIEVEVTEAEADSAATPRAELTLVDPSPETAQTVLGAYIDWRRAQGVNGIDRRMTGLLAKQLRQAFDAGHPPDVIKRGLLDWHERDQHPATLASFIDVQARGGHARASPTKAERQRQQLYTYDQALGAWADQMEAQGSEPQRVAPDRRQAQRELPRPGDPA